MKGSGESLLFAEKLKNTFIGKAKLIQDKGLFHKLTLIAFFAWIGLGADGISSSCYGPEEAFRNLQGHPSLAIFVAIDNHYHKFKLQPDSSFVSTWRRRIPGWQ
jgi:hypothetical protein